MAFMYVCCDTYNDLGGTVYDPPQEVFFSEEEMAQGTSCNYFELIESSIPRKVLLEEILSLPQQERKEFLKELLEALKEPSRKPSSFIETFRTIVECLNERANGVKEEEKNLWIAAALCVESAKEILKKLED